jgi:hypothetical protein
MTAQVDTYPNSVGQSCKRAIFHAAIRTATHIAIQAYIVQSTRIGKRNPHAAYRDDSLKTRMDTASAASAILNNDTADIRLDLKSSENKT